MSTEQTSGDSVALHVLNAVGHALETQLYPELQSDDARVAADMMVRLLKWLSLRQAALYGSDARRTGALGRLFAASGPPECSGAVGDEPAECRQAFFKNLLAQGLAGGRASAAPADTIDRYVAIETAFVHELDPEGAASMADNYEGGRAAASQFAATHEIPVNDATLTGYLRTRFPQHPQIQAVGTRALVGGIGKDTIVCDIESGGNHSGSVVIRKDLPISPIGVTVVDEFPLLVQLAAHEIPVPTPLWAEHSAAPLGTRFIVVRKMSGSIDTTSWIKDPAASRRFANELARIMARIHALGPQQLGHPELADCTAAEGTHEAVLSMLDLYRRNSESPNPRLEATFGWLLANIPDCEGRSARLVHGDIGFHNLLMHEGQVTAVLDWEFNHFGDPADDVSYCRPFVERVLPWQEFLSMYQACGGAPYSAEQDRFFSVWRNARNAASCVGSRGAFMQARIGSVKLATGGLIYGPRFEIEALRSIVGGST